MDEELWVKIFWLISDELSNQRVFRGLTSAADYIAPLATELLGRPVVTNRTRIKLPDNEESFYQVGPSTYLDSRKDYFWRNGEDYILDRIELIKTICAERGDETDLEDLVGRIIGRTAVPQEEVDRFYNSLTPEREEELLRLYHEMTQHKNTNG